MESRYRTILPIVGILLVLIVALIAFFITRRIRNAVASPSPSASEIAQDTVAPNDLLLPSTSPSGASKAMPRQTIGKVKTAPATGPQDHPTFVYSTALDDNGFRELTTQINKGTVLIWVNLGTKSQSLTMQSAAVAPDTVEIKPNEKFSYEFDNSQTYTITLQGATHPQQITVK